MKWTKEEIKTLMDLRDKGFTIKEIARVLNTSYKSVETALDRYSIPRQRGSYYKSIRNRVVKCIKQGYTYEEIAKTVDLTHSQVKYIIEKYNLKEKAIEKIGFLDIECSNFSSDFGIIFSYCIKELDGDLITNVIKPKEIKNGTYDKRLVKDFLEDLKKFDRIVGYYAKKFDIPFLRSRCIYYNLRFPPYGTHFFNDVYYLVKNRLRLHRNRLEDACRYFDIPCKSHPLVPSVWLKAMKGDKKALNYILEHNKEDVISLEALWKKIYMYGLIGRRSI